MEVTQYRDTGELSDLTVNVSENEFKLHKFPLYIKSEYFKQNAQDKDTIDLEEFPGGKATFSLVADFCYGKPIDFTLGNIAGLRNAAEYLIMKGSGNLITVTEKYIEDILNSAKLSRSVAPIMEILVQCDELGEEGDVAKVGQQCFNAIVDIWMRPFSRFSSPMDSVGRGGGRYGDYGGSSSYEDNLITDRLVNMPLKWLKELIKACGDHESKLKGLAELIYKYLARVFTEVDKKNKGKKKKAKKTDEEGEEEEPEPEEKEEEKGENPGNTLDEVIMNVPEATPLADLITVDWIRRALEISEEYNCECRERLLQLAGNVLHKFSNEELKQIPSATLCEIIDNTIRNEKVVPEVLAGVLDNYMSELAKKKNLSVDDFVKLVNCIPENYRINHDTLFDVLEVLLTSGEEIPDEQRKELLDAVDLSRCHEDTLQRALEKNIIPVRDLCQAAINLAARLRKEKDEPERVPKYTDEIRPMRGNYSTSPRYTPSYGMDYDSYGRYGGASKSPSPATCCYTKATKLCEKREMSPERSSSPWPISPTGVRTDLRDNFHRDHLSYVRSKFNEPIKEEDIAHLRYHLKRCSPKSSPWSLVSPSSNLFVGRSHQPSCYHPEPYHLDYSYNTGYNNKRACHYFECNPPHIRSYSPR